MKEIEIDVGDDTELSNIIEKIIRQVSLLRTDNPMKWKITYPHEDLANLTGKQRIDLFCYLFWYFKLSLEMSDSKAESEPKKALDYAR